MGAFFRSPEKSRKLGPQLELPLLYIRFGLASWIRGSNCARIKYFASAGGRLGYRFPLGPRDELGTSIGRFSPFPCRHRRRPYHSRFPPYPQPYPIIDSSSSSSSSLSLASSESYSTFAASSLSAPGSASCLVPFEFS